MDFLFELKKDDREYNITECTYNFKIKDKNNKIFVNYAELIKKMNDEELKNNILKYYLQKGNFFSADKNNNGFRYLLDLFEINNPNYLLLNHNLNINKNTKQDIILCKFIHYSKENFCDKEYDIYIENLNIFKILLNTSFKKGSNLVFSIFNYCTDININFIYLLSLFFEKIIIADGNIIFCLDYNENDKYKNIILNKNLSNNEYLNIEPKNNEKILLKYLNDYFNNKIKLCKIILKKNEEKLYINEYKYYLSILGENNLLKNTLMKHYIENFRRFFIKNGKIEIKIHSAIKKEEGRLITELIKKYNLKKCVEVGMAFGTSAFYILSCENTTLISIDPFQTTQWKSMGLNLIKEMKLNDRHTLIEKKSYIGLPEIIQKYGENNFDFVFIDGWHVFDATLLDFYFSDKLIKIGGIILIDDALHKGVEKCVKYIDKNWTSYERIKCYKKISEDNRLLVTIN